MRSPIRAVAAALATAGVVLTGLASPPPALACFGEAPCPLDTVREWVGQRPVGVYRFDVRHSAWTRSTGLCYFEGTLVFRRIETLKGAPPDEITLTVRPTEHPWECPEWDSDNGGWDWKPKSPGGRWIVVLGSDPASTDSAWLHLTDGWIDNWAIGDFGWPDIPGGRAGTLAGMRSALQAPDTSTADPPAAARTAPALLLALAALGGLVLGLRRTTRARL